MNSRTLPAPASPKRRSLQCLKQVWLFCISVGAIALILYGNAQSGIFIRFEDSSIPAYFITSSVIASLTAFIIHQLGFQASLAMSFVLLALFISLVRASHGQQSFKTYPNTLNASLLGFCTSLIKTTARSVCIVYGEPQQRIWYLLLLIIFEKAGQLLGPFIFKLDINIDWTVEDKLELHRTLIVYPICIASVLGFVSIVRITNPNRLIRTDGIPIIYSKCSSFASRLFRSWVIPLSSSGYLWLCLSLLDSKDHGVVSSVLIAKTSMKGLRNRITAFGTLTVSFIISFIISPEGLWPFLRDNLLMVKQSFLDCLSYLTPKHTVLDGSPEEVEAQRESDHGLHRVCQIPCGKLYKDKNFFKKAHRLNLSLFFLQTCLMFAETQLQNFNEDTITFGIFQKAIEFFSGFGFEARTLYNYWMLGYFAGNSISLALYFSGFMVAVKSLSIASLWVLNTIFDYIDAGRINNGKTVANYASWLWKILSFFGATKALEEMRKTSNEPLYDLNEGKSSKYSKEITLKGSTNFQADGFNDLYIKRLAILQHRSTELINTSVSFKAKTSVLMNVGDGKLLRSAVKCDPDFAGADVNERVLKSDLSDQFFFILPHK